jgi:two-component system, chemotaxis family, sensor kinase CheA
VNDNDELAARLLATFVEELGEQVRLLDTELLALERDPAAAESFGAVFRCIHSLKGAARAAGVGRIERVCHDLESLLASVRAGTTTLAPAHFTILFSAADALRDAAERLRRGETLERARIASLVVDPDTVAAAPRPATDARVPPAAPIWPPVSSIAEQHVPPPEPIEAPPLPGASRAEVLVPETRVQAARLDELVAATGELLIASAWARELSQELRDVEEAASRALRGWRQARPALRVALEQGGTPAAPAAAAQMEHALDTLAATAQRLRARERGVGVLRRSSEHVADQVRRLRMRPFADACEALPRAVRDIAVGSGKDVELRLDGKDVEADRAVLDGLGEMLLQLVRNAVDHGIEPPHQREGLGKPAQGTVTVAAELRGERLLIRVEDDGAGIDLARVRAALQRQGLAVPIHDADVLQLLLRGGVSTRRTATSISGRGVGLEVVWAGMERMRGRVEVQTEPRAGTTFVLECAPALATVRALLVRVGTQTLALPISAVSRALRIRPEDIRRAEGRNVLSGEETPTPVVTLARVLGLTSAEPARPATPAVLLCAGAASVALLVDELVTEQELIVRPLADIAERPPHVSGAALLSSGAVTLLLNPFTLVEAARAERSDAHAVEPRTQPEQRRRRILVVDDSITTRTLEQSILEAVGYDVSTAVDGADAWRFLQEHLADLVVSDVEMPRVDGFALCRLIRASKRLRDLPIVLVSALESTQHRQRGLEVGADAYLGKSSFDQERLLELIRQLIGQATL